MSVKTIRKKLHQFVDTMEHSRKELIFSIREKVLSGEIKTYKWEEVKEMIKNKKFRNTV